MVNFLEEKFLCEPDRPSLTPSLTQGCYRDFSAHDRRRLFSNPNSNIHFDNLIFPEELYHPSVRNFWLVFLFIISSIFASTRLLIFSLSFIFHILYRIRNENIYLILMGNLSYLYLRPWYLYSMVTLIYVSMCGVKLVIRST